MEAGRNSKPWTAEEDEKLRDMAERYDRQWKVISDIWKTRTPLQLKTRFRTVAALHFPKSGGFTQEEDRQLLKLREEKNMSFFEISLEMKRRLSSCCKRYRLIKQQQSTTVREVVKGGSMDKASISAIEKLVDERLPGRNTEWTAISSKFPQHPPSRIREYFRAKRTVWTDKLDQDLANAVLERYHSPDAPPKLKAFLKTLSETTPSTFKQVTVSDLTMTPQEQEELNDVAGDLEWAPIAKELGGHFDERRVRRRWVFLAHLDRLLQKPIVRQANADKTLGIWCDLMKMVNDKAIPVAHKRKLVHWLSKPFNDQEEDKAPINLR
ncbi:hypothetical protein HDU67_005849, partial [Dinochytrium kinnereticum]